MVARYKSVSTKQKPRGRPFPKGVKPIGSGRKVGTVNRVPALLKDAIMTTMDLEGMDRRGKDGVIGFLRQASRSEPAAFLSLVGKVLPLQINAKVQAEMTVTGKYKDANIRSMTLEQKQEALAEILGLTRPLIEKPRDNEVLDAEFSEVAEEVKEAAE